MKERSPQQMATDYDRVERAISYICDHATEQPGLEEIAAAIGLSPFHFQRLFSRWAGVSPRRFLGYLTLTHAKTALDRSATVLEATYDAGLSAPSRLHDLFVTFQAVTPGEYRSMGNGLEIKYGVHTGIYGEFLVAVTDRGICGLRFTGAEKAESILAEMGRDFPDARFVQAQEETRQFCGALFSPDRSAAPLKLWCRGTNFQIRVWEALLSIPPGALATYKSLGRAIGSPGAARAVGQAVAANPVAAVIPCHRVIRATALLDTNYRWGTARKLAMIGREQAQTCAVMENGGEPLQVAGIPRTSNMV